MVSGNRLKWEAPKKHLSLSQFKKKDGPYLQKEHEKVWLATEQSETQIKGIIVPYNTNVMKAYPVTNKLIKLGFNTSEKTIIEPF